MVPYEAEVFDGYLEPDPSDSGQFFSTEAESSATSLLLVSPSVSAMLGAPDPNFMRSPTQVTGNFVSDPELQGFDQFEIESLDWAQYLHDHMEMEFEVNLFDVDPAWIENTYQISDNPLSRNTHQAQLMLAGDSPTTEGGTLDTEDLLPDSETEFDQVQEASIISEACSSTSTSRSRWPKVLWLVSACNIMSSTTLRPKVPQELPTTGMIKGVVKKGNKWTCETRVMKKRRQKNSKYSKVWLGTYETPVQAARALDVGKFFFCAKKNKNFYDPRSKSILEGFFSHLVSQPLEVLVINVKKLAQHYGLYGPPGIHNLVI